jgi:putative ABC transport system permease protein
MISDYLVLAVKNIKHRKVRSWLTIIGVIIGIAAIIALISLSFGLRDTIEGEFSEFGADKILVTSGTSQGPLGPGSGLTDDDLEELRKIPEIKTVVPIVTRGGTVEYRRETRFPGVIGTEPKGAEDFFGEQFPLSVGRYLRAGDKFDVVLGSRTATELFSKELRINNRITINGVSFKVVGIFEERGNQGDDNALHIPLETFREIFDIKDEVNFMWAQVKPGNDILEVQKKIERRLERSRDDENFQVLTPTQILNQINQILGVLQAVLVGIAAISLVVGGIGIMNAMYTTVLERTKDIGVMKAIGAKNSDILSIFLIEAGLVGLVGGVFGVILGIIISFGIARLATESGFKLLISINPNLIVFGLFFAFVVGILSGLIPAYQASKMHPVEALRQE